jgi:hypothetical protein
VKPSARMAACKVALRNIFIGFVEFIGLSLSCFISLYLAGERFSGGQSTSTDAVFSQMSSRRKKIAQILRSSDPHIPRSAWKQ